MPRDRQSLSRAVAILFELLACLALGPLAALISMIRMIKNKVRVIRSLPRSVDELSCRYMRDSSLIEISPAWGILARSDQFETCTDLRPFVLSQGTSGGLGLGWDSWRERGECNQTDGIIGIVSTWSRRCRIIPT
jgi:hypothetical protein